MNCKPAAYRLPITQGRLSCNLILAEKNAADSKPQLCLSLPLESYFLRVVFLLVVFFLVVFFLVVFFFVVFFLVVFFLVVLFLVVFFFAVFLVAFFFVVFFLVTFFLVAFLLTVRAILTAPFLSIFPPHLGPTTRQLNLTECTGGRPTTDHTQMKLHNS